MFLQGGLSPHCTLTSMTRQVGYYSSVPSAQAPCGSPFGFGGHQDSALGILFWLAQGNLAAAWIKPGFDSVQSRSHFLPLTPEVTWCPIRGKAAPPLD